MKTYVGTVGRTYTLKWTREGGRRQPLGPGRASRAWGWEEEEVHSAGHRQRGQCNPRNPIIHIRRLVMQVDLEAAVMFTVDTSLHESRFPVISTMALLWIIKLNLLCGRCFSSKDTLCC